MKKIISLVCCALCAMYISAQGVDEVTLVVYGDGGNKEEATHVALRNAIEQAYGTFVSANTTILNDSVVKDEIITISSGNIQRYEEISCSQLGNGKTEVTLKATVSVNKLVKYAQSKGAECEFAGATFAANVKLYNLYEENVKKILDNLLLKIKNTDNLFDYKINIGTPRFSDSTFSVGYEIRVFSNANTINMIEDIGNTLKAIGLTEEEMQTFEAMGYPFTECPIRYIYVATDENGQCYLSETPDERFYMNPNRYKYLEIPNWEDFLNRGKYLYFPNIKRGRSNNHYDVLVDFGEKLRWILFKKITLVSITNNINSVIPIYNSKNKNPHRGWKSPVWIRDFVPDRIFCQNVSGFFLGIILGMRIHRNEYEIYSSDIPHYAYDFPFIILTHVKKTVQLYMCEGTFELTENQLMQISKFWLINSDGSPVPEPSQDDEKEVTPIPSSKNVKSTEQSSSNKKIITKDTQAKESVSDSNQQANVEIVIPQITANNIIDKMGDTPITSDTVYTLGEIGAKDNLSASIAFLLNEEYEDVSFDVSINSAVYEKMVSLHSVNQQNSKDTDKYFDISYRRVRLPRYDKTCDMLYLKIEGMDGLKTMSDLPKNISIPLTVQHKYSRRNITSKTIWIQCIVK